MLEYLMIILWYVVTTPSYGNGRWLEIYVKDGGLLHH